MRNEKGHHIISERYDFMRMLKQRIIFQKSLNKRTCVRNKLEFFNNHEIFTQQVTFAKIKQLLQVCKDKRMKNRLEE